MADVHSNAAPAAGPNINREPAAANPPGPQQQPTNPVFVLNANQQQMPRQRNRLNTVSQYRDRLFHAIFYKTSVAYGTRFSPLLRRLIEMFFLMMALGSFFTLVYIHVAFTQSPSTCLDHVRTSWPRDGVLRVEILPSEMLAARERLWFDQLKLDPFGITSVARSAWVLDKDQCPVLPLDLSPVRYSNDSLLLEPSRSEPAKPDALHSFGQTISRILSMFELRLPETTIHRHRLATNETIKLARRLMWAGDEFTDQTSETDDSNVKYPPGLVQFEHEMLIQLYRVEYSLQYGFLRLSDQIRKRLNIPVMVVQLNPDNDTCFGDKLSRTMLREFLGYDDLLMTSVKTLAEQEDNRGFLRNCVTGDHFRFVSMWSRGSYLMAFFVMILFTVSISMLLRYSHHQIFVCIVDLLQMMDTNGRLGFPAAPLLTVILALVGMEAIMSEFFNDTTTAFYIILIVWISDQYDAICCHTPISKRHWLRFFYLYHYTFYAYHYRFNGQYSSLALWTSSLFILHSMVYFFHHHELPTIMHQHRLQQIIRIAHQEQQQQQQQPTAQAATAAAAAAAATANIDAPNAAPTVQRQFLYVSNATLATMRAAATADVPQPPNDTNNNPPDNRSLIHRLFVVREYYRQRQRARVMRPLQIGGNASAAAAAPAVPDTRDTYQRNNEENNYVVEANDEGAVGSAAAATSTTTPPSSLASTSSTIESETVGQQRLNPDGSSGPATIPSTDAQSGTDPVVVSSEEPPLS